MSQGHIIVVGTSMGGTEALQGLFSSLDADFPVPVVVVLHRGANSDYSLVQYLQDFCPLRIREPEDKEKIVSGWVYLAPADYHLMVEDDCFSLSTDPRVNYARPSIDVLFDSASEFYGEACIGVIMTGASSDGARGLASIKRHGGFTIVQDPKTAKVPTMPEAAIKCQMPDKICAVEQIVPEIRKYLTLKINNDSR